MYENTIRPSVKFLYLYRDLASAYPARKLMAMFIRDNIAGTMKLFLIAWDRALLHSIPVLR